MSAVTADRGEKIPDELIDAALRLPEQARARFASALLRSLDKAGDDPEVVRKEWKDEIARRIDEVRSGKVKPVDGHEALLQARQRLREQYGV
jgi:putative addiction module component (TIGR02574 family)